MRTFIQNPFTLLSTLTLVATLSGCGDDSATSSVSSSQTTGITSITTDTSSTDNPTTDTTDVIPTTSNVDPSHPDGSASDSASGTDTGETTIDDSSTGETTGKPACVVTCQEVFNLSNYFDQDDYDFVPCEEYGEKALDFAEMVEMAVLSERFGALCKPFDQNLHKTDQNVSKLAERTDLEENALRCIEFLGYELMNFPPDLSKEVCLEDAKKLRDFLEEDVFAYQTQHKIPDELLPNANIYQTVGHVEVGTLEEQFIEEFEMGTDGTGTKSPQKCRLRMDHITAWGTESFTTDDKPFDWIMTYEIPNQNVIKPGYNRLLVECMITDEQIGWGFGTNAGINDVMDMLGTRNHNLYDMSAWHEVIAP